MATLSTGLVESISSAQSRSYHAGEGSWWFYRHDSRTVTLGVDCLVLPGQAHAVGASPDEPAGWNKWLVGAVILLLLYRLFLKRKQQ